MGLQVFPELFYTKLLCDGERIGLTEDNQRFTILPPESFSSRVKRFFTFQQDPYIERVHDRIKNILEQFRQAQGPDFSTIKTEIHDHGNSKYQYLEANLLYLREKLDEVGQINCISSLLLTIRNAIAQFFGIEPIQLCKFARTYINGRGIIQICPDIRFERSFNIHPGNLYTTLTPLRSHNPMQEQGLSLTVEDINSCRFSAESPYREVLPKLEKGLESYLFLNAAVHPSTHIVANLELSFDSERQRFFVAINNPRAKPIDSPILLRMESWPVPDSFADRFPSMPQEERTFRFFIRATDPQGNETEQELVWTAEATSLNPFKLNKGSQPFYLEPGVQYQFLNQEHQPIQNSMLKITDLRRDQ